jgi:hypothetical protein
MNTKHYIETQQVSAEEFEAQIAELDFKAAKHSTGDNGERYTWPFGYVVELQIGEEINEYGHSREQRIWTFKTKKHPNIEELGKLGEHIARLYIDNGALSQKKYDSEKDLLAEGGSSVEVKTSIRFNKFNAFTINESQRRKCENARVLLFVEYCHMGDTINVWHCVNNKDLASVELNNGRTRLAYYVDEMILIDSITAPRLAQKMRELSPSYLCK